MRTFETEKHNIPEGATHYSDSSDERYFSWFMHTGDEWFIQVWSDKDWVKCKHNEQDESGVKPIPQASIETPEEKEALDLIDTTPHQYEMSKFKSNPVIQLSIDEIDKFSGEPRTKVEYVKVSAPCDFFDLKSEFRGEELSFINGDGDYEAATTLAELVTGFDNMNLYRRIETPMTEREAFIYSYGKVRNEFANQSAIVDFCEFMYNSGKFKLAESN